MLSLLCTKRENRLILWLPWTVWLSGIYRKRAGRLYHQLTNGSLENTPKFRVLNSSPTWLLNPINLLRPRFSGDQGWKQHQRSCYLGTATSNAYRGLESDKNEWWSLGRGSQGMVGLRQTGNRSIYKNTVWAKENRAASQHRHAGCSCATYGSKLIQTNFVYEEIKVQRGEVTHSGSRSRAAWTRPCARALPAPPCNPVTCPLAEAGSPNGVPPSSSESW